MRVRRRVAVVAVVAAALGLPATGHAADDTAPAAMAPTAATGVDTTFSFAVIPDTQNETYAGEVRMQKRVEWLLANRQSLDLRWVLHSGDVHNWPTPNQEQFAAMSEWVRPLQAAGLPLILTPGNHDTAAVCPGGSACPGQNTNLALRDTSTWNAYYSPARFGFNGVFEAGKSDSGWRAFSAGGKDWLVLSLELWPRTAVIGWARQVVASHPHHNVIVVTHAFLEGDGSLSTYNGGYGANSPATLWNALDDYPNVVMTFSGHVGVAANSSLTATDGHRVATFLQTFHDPSLNPTRIVTVDTAAGTISTRIVANWDRLLGLNVDREYTEYRATYNGMRFVGAPPETAVHLRRTASPGPPDGSFVYGVDTYQHLLCDFDGDGADGIVAFDGGNWFIRSTATAGAPEVAFSYGAAGYTPVCGDWDGDGDDGIGVYDRGRWYLRQGASAGPPQIAFEYGIADYVPVTGDWDGVGGDGVGVYVGGAWHLRQTPSPGRPELAYWYGTPDYEPVTGDWDGDGTDGTGVFVNGDWYLRTLASPGPPQIAFSYGAKGNRPVVGDFDGDGRDGSGVVALQG